jgi:phage-related holin
MFTDLINYLGTWQIQVITTLLAIDVLLGIIAALIRKEFVWGKLANFMKEPVLAFVFGFAIVEIVAAALPTLNFIVIVSFVIIVIGILASIFKNLAKIGIPVPDHFKK